MRSLWCNSFWIGIILFTGLYRAQGQVPFNISISDTFFSSWGLDILVEDNAFVLTSRVDPNGIDEFVQRVTKHNLDGSIQWNTILKNKAVHSFGIPHDNNIIKTDSGYIIIGNAKDTNFYFNPTLALLEKNGTEVKQINLTDSIGTKPFIMSSAVKKDSTIILGCIQSQGATQAARPQFIEIDHSGRVMSNQILFTGTYRVPVSMDYYGERLFVCGYRGEVSGSDKDAWAAVLDAQYNILFETPLGDPNIFNSSESIVATPDGGFVVSYVADSTNYTGSWHSYFVKYGSTFQKAWARKLPLSGRSLIRDISLLRDDAILFGGDFQDSINDPIIGLIGKIDFQGEFHWMRAYQQNPTTRREYVKVAKELPSDHLVFTGYTFPDDPSGIITHDTWLFLTDSTGCIVPSECDSIPLGVETETPSISPLTLYPNPAGEFVHLSLPNDHLPAQYEVYSLTGQLVAAGAAEFALHKIDTGKLGNGLYVVRVYRDGKTVGMEKFSKH